MSNDTTISLNIIYLSRTIMKKFTLYLAVTFHLKHYQQSGDVQNRVNASFLLNPWYKNTDTDMINKTTIAIHQIARSPSFCS